MTTLKLALRLAFSTDVRQRWRQVSVMLAGFVATTIALLALGMVHLAQDSDARIAARSPIWASDAHDARLHLSARGLSMDGYGQFPVVWLDPVAGHADDPAVVPPGLSRLPDPGEGVLSQGLVSRGWTAEDFGLRSSTAGCYPSRYLTMWASWSVATGGYENAPPGGGRRGVGRRVDAAVVIGDGVFTRCFR